MKNLKKVGKTLLTLGKILVKLLIMLIILIILLVLVGGPFIIFLAFPNNEIVKQVVSKDATDVLGYYGTVIGGVVTVLGVYWTLNYESKKSKEERRKDSLPILRFDFTPDKHLCYEEGTIVDYKADENGKLFSNYDIVLNTTRGKRGFKKYSKHSFLEYGKLNIENVGLGVAVLSRVYLKRNEKEILCHNLGCRELETFLVIPDKKITLSIVIRSDDFNEEDQLIVYFKDLYSNKYCYVIPFKNIEYEFSDFKTTIKSNTVKSIPKLIQRNK